MYLCISPTYGAELKLKQRQQRRWFFLCIGLLHRIANAVRCTHCAVPFSFSMYANVNASARDMCCSIENCLSIPSNRMSIRILLWQCQRFLNALGSAPYRCTDAVVVFLSSQSLNILFRFLCIVCVYVCVCVSYKKVNAMLQARYLLMCLLYHSFG